MELGKRSRFSQEVDGCDHFFEEALYPNCRLGSALGYFDDTVVTLREGMAILEVKREGDANVCCGRSWPDL